jgi:hypothetical protein
MCIAQRILLSTGRWSNFGQIFHEMLPSSKGSVAQIRAYRFSYCFQWIRILNNTHRSTDRGRILHLSRIMSTTHSSNDASILNKAPESITKNIGQLDIPGVLSALKQMELQYVKGKRAWVPRHEFLASDRSAANHADKEARVPRPNLSVQIQCEAGISTVP